MKIVAQWTTERIAFYSLRKERRRINVYPASAGSVCSERLQSAAILNRWVNGWSEAVQRGLAISGKFKSSNLQIQDHE